MARLDQVTAGQIITALAARRILTPSSWLSVLVGDILECHHPDFVEFVSRVAVMADSVQLEDVGFWIANTGLVAADCIADSWNPKISGEENLRRALSDFIKNLACRVWDIAKEL